MTTVRRLALLLAAPLALAGCGNETCPTEVAQVSGAPAPSACTLAADAVVSVSLELCTKCNQSVPACEVVPPSGAPGDRAYQLDTFAQACTDDGSCLPGCPLVPPVVTCRFRTPAASGPYDFVIFDSVGGQQTIPFTIAAGGTLSCSG